MKIFVRQSLREAQHRGGVIALVADANHLNGALQLSLSYKFGNEKSVNHVECVKVTPIYPKQNETTLSVDLYPDNTIITGIETALRYFEYVTKHLAGRNRTHPVSFQDWLAQRNNCSAQTR